MSLLPVSTDSSAELSAQLAQRLAAGMKIGLVGLKMDALKSDTAEAILRRSGAQGGYQLTFSETGQSFMLSATQARLFVPQSSESARVLLRLEVGPNGEAQASLESELGELSGASGARAEALAKAAGAPAGPIGSAAANLAANPSLRLSGAGQALAMAEQSVAHLPTGSALSSLAGLSASSPADSPRASIADFASALSRILPSEGIGYERALARLTLSEASTGLPAALERFAQISSPDSLGPGAEGAPGIAAVAQSARAQETSSASWSGALWPGATAQALVGSSPKASQAFDESERDPWLPSRAADEPASWLRLNLDLPGLGGLEIWAAHIGGHTFARLKTPSGQSSETLRSLLPSFEKELEKSRVSLTISEAS